VIGMQTGQILGHWDRGRWIEYNMSICMANRGMDALQVARPDKRFWR